VKPMIEWFKKNWLIAALGLVAVVSLPVLWVLSSRMNARLVAEAQKKAEDDYKEVSNTKLTYRIPRATPSGKDFDYPEAPNKVLVAYFKERLTEQQQQIAAVWETALEFNRGTHQPLIEGLFPAPSEMERFNLPARFREAYIERLPEQLLAIASAGAPPEADKVLATVRENAERAVARIRTEKGRDPTEAEVATIKQEMSALRIQRYRQRASEIATYADRLVFLDIPEPPKPDNRTPPAPPTLRQAWDWQEIAWVLEDIMRAVATANGGAAAAGGVPASVVKRVLSIKVGAPVLVGSAASEGAISAQQTLPRDFNLSLTGRVGGPGNQLFDVRPVTLEIVASSRRLPAFLDALAATNFITVLDADLYRVEPVEELAQGYYYGDEHVVRAVLQLETVALREWTVPWMPAEVRGERGVEQPEKPADPAAKPADPAAPPPPGAG